MLSRRQFVETLGAAGAAALTPRAASAQPAQGPPSTVTTPPRDFGPNAPPPTYFTDPDVLTVDPLFGRIRPPEDCGNLCFGGAKRNRLSMAASQSLYAVYVNTRGAAPA